MASDLTQVRAMHGRGDGAPVGVRGGYTGRESPPSQARVASSSGTDCASDAGGGAAALTTNHIMRGPRQRQAQALSRDSPAGGAMPADEVSRCGKCPKFQKISKGQGLCPRTPGSTPCSYCAAPRWRARKKRTSRGGDMESACHVGALRAKREKIFGGLFWGGPCII